MSSGFPEDASRELSRDHSTRTRLQRPRKIFLFFHKHQVVLRSRSDAGHAADLDTPIPLQAGFNCLSNLLQ